MKKENKLLILLTIGSVLIAGYLLKPAIIDINENKPIENLQEELVKETQNLKNMELQINTTKEGAGEEIQNGQIAVVHYTGTLDDGTVFDSSIPRGEPFSFPLGAGYVIEGWDKGVLGMKVGEIRELIIPSNLGYGDRGQGVIPPGATLIFQIELLEIK